MMTLRKYQIECVDAIWRNLDKHCVASLPTGSGKTPCIAELIRRFLEYPGTHILLLTHKRELIRQNYDTLVKHLPFTVDVGIYCAGLRSKELKQVTIASVQSMVNAKDVPDFEIIIIDEAHLCPHESDGQYHEVFARFPKARIIGVTATPFRLKGGMLHKGKHKLFDALVYEAKTSKLIDEGWLSPIRAISTSDHADMSDVHIRCGDYKPEEMTAAMDQAKITKAAVCDVMLHAADRKSILVFCAGVEHARHVQDEFLSAGETSIATVTQETSMYDRDDCITRFKDRTLRIMVNVGVFTTGFDAPGVDCVVLLRATQSPGLYIQIIGRGLRKAEGKKECLLLDYGENISRFGPIDMITCDTVEEGKGAPPTKPCPQCSTIIFAGLATCPQCGYVFPKEEKETIKHGTKASDIDPIRPTVITTFDVHEVEYSYHKGKKGKPDSMRVSYYTGICDIVSEWVCLMHQGFAKQKAQAWFARRGISPMPKTIEEAIEAAKKAVFPGKITTRKNGKYDEIISMGAWKNPINEEEVIVKNENEPDVTDDDVYKMPF